MARWPSLQRSALSRRTARPGGRPSWIGCRPKGRSGDIAGAIAGYREFAQAYADDERAPEALSRAATLLSRQGDAEATLQQQLDLGRRYPASAQAHDALFAAGWSLFRANRLEEARAAWDVLRQNTAGSVAAQAAFWAARATDPQSADYASRLDAAIAAAPDSYYGVARGRAAGQAAGRHGADRRADRGRELARRRRLDRQHGRARRRFISKSAAIHLS